MDFTVRTLSPQESRVVLALAEQKRREVSRPEIIKLLGQLKFRTSYGQNVLAHSVETAHLAGMMASELKANVATAKAGALLHDIGKAVTHEVGGAHALIGADIVRKYGINGPQSIAKHRTPGFGDSNWTDIITELRLGGFKGCIDIEGWHDPVYRGDLEMTGQVHGLNYLKRCRGGAFVPNPAV